MKYKLVSEGLTEEIEKKYNLIREIDVSKRALKCNKLIRKAILENAQIHSYRIEHPENNVPFSIPRNKNRRYLIFNEDNKPKKVRIRDNIKEIQEGFNWGYENFNVQEFDNELIKGIAFRITPELYKGMENAEYRSKGTAIKGASVTPPYPQKVVVLEMPWFEESMRKRLKCDKLINHIETAIFSHLHLARIHPFVDGNGRTSRTLQDVILDSYGIPLPVIEAGERMTYYEILDGAVDQWKDGGRDRLEISDGERLFYDFIAGKINMSFDKILNSCISN